MKAAKPGRPLNSKAVFPHGQLPELLCLFSIPFGSCPGTGPALRTDPRGSLCPRRGHRGHFFHRWRPRTIAGFAKPTALGLLGTWRLFWLSQFPELYLWNVTGFHQPTATAPFRILTPPPFPHLVKAVSVLTGAHTVWWPVINADKGYW